MNTSQVVRYLFHLIIAILVLFGVGSFLRMNDNPARAGLYVLYAFIMIGDAAGMAYCVWLLNKRAQWTFYMAVTVLSLNIFPTIFDQFGFVDLLFLLLNLITLILLFIARKEFLPV